MAEVMDVEVDSIGRRSDRQPEKLEEAQDEGSSMSSPLTRRDKDTPRQRSDDDFPTDTHPNPLIDYNQHARSRFPPPPAPGPPPTPTGQSTADREREYLMRRSTMFPSFGDCGHSPPQSSPTPVPFKRSRDDNCLGSPSAFEERRVGYDNCCGYAQSATGASSGYADGKMHTRYRSSVFCHGSKAVQETGCNWDISMSDEAQRSASVSSQTSNFKDIKQDQLQPQASLLLNRRIVLNTELLNTVQSLASSSERVPPSFAPVTPDKQKGLDGEQLRCTTQIDRGQDQTSAHQALDSKAKEQVIWLYPTQAVSEQTCLASAGLSAQLHRKERWENAEHEVDLNKASAQKPRRKKHRPKVIVEGKPARTPKQVTPKPPTPNPKGVEVGTPGKRKYIQRKGLSTPLETPTNVSEGETIKTQVKKAKSVKRKLDFSSEHVSVTDTEQAQGEFVPDKNKQYSSKNTVHGISTADVVSGVQKIDANSSGTASSLIHPSNQVFDSYIQFLQQNSPLQPLGELKGIMSSEKTRVVNREEAQGESMPEKNIGCNITNNTMCHSLTSTIISEGNNADVNSSEGVGPVLNHPDKQVYESYLQYLKPCSPLQPFLRELKTLETHMEKARTVNNKEQAPEESIHEKNAGCSSGNNGMHGTSTMGMVSGGVDMDANLSKEITPVLNHSDNQIFESYLQYLKPFGPCQPFLRELNMEKARSVNNKEQAQETIHEKNAGCSSGNNGMHGTSTMGVVSGGVNMDANLSEEITPDLNHSDNPVFESYLQYLKPFGPCQPFLRELNMEKARSVNNKEQAQEESIHEKNAGCSSGNNGMHGTSTMGVVSGVNVDANLSEEITPVLNHSGNQVFERYLQSLKSSGPCQPFLRELNMEKARSDNNKEQAQESIHEKNAGCRSGNNGMHGTSTLGVVSGGVNVDSNLSEEITPVLNHSDNPVFESYLQSLKPFGPCQPFLREPNMEKARSVNNKEQAQEESVQAKSIEHNMYNNTVHSTSTSNVGIPSALKHPSSQVFDSFLDFLKIPSLTFQPSRRELIRENLKKLARIKGQVPNDECFVESEVKAFCQSALENPSIISGSKKNDVTKLKNVNATIIDFSQISVYNEIDQVSAYSRDRNKRLSFFPETPKKRRTHKVQNVFAFSKLSSTKDSQKDLERQSAMESKQAPLVQANRKSRKRSEVLIQCSNLTSLADMTNVQRSVDPQNSELNGGRQEHRIIHEPQACLKYLATDTLAKVKRKTRTKKVRIQDFNISPDMTNVQLSVDPQNSELNGGRQEHRIIHEPQACLKSLATDTLAKVSRKTRTKKVHIQDFNISPETCNINNTLGASIPCTQNDDLHFLDVIVCKMRCLNINRDLEDNKVQEQSAMVPYVGHRMVVPFEGLFDLRKKSHPRAKVDLDQETNRVWNLLMGKEYEGIEGKDIDKEKWWEEERCVFRGRADSFIARDRRFSPWKGSVLDSVIGVFLTQNVSDHLSSSAFMALAAKFPCESRRKSKEASRNEGSTSMGNLAVCFIDLNKTDEVSNNHACDQVHIDLLQAEKMVEKKMQPDVYVVEGERFPCSNTNFAPLRVVRSLTEADDRRFLDDICSSQNSVVSSQNSSDDLGPTAELVGSLLTSRTEALNLLTSPVCNLECRTSFLELLEMAGTSRLQVFSSPSSGKNIETESLNKQYANIIKYGSLLGEVTPSISPVIPAELKGLDDRVCTLAENETEMAALTPQSVFSGDLHEYMANLSAQSLSGSSTNDDFIKHHCEDYIFCKVKSKASAINNFNDKARAEERMQEVHREKDIFCENIENVCMASETTTPTARHVCSDPEYVRNKSEVAKYFDNEGKRSDVSDKGTEYSKEEVCCSIKEPVEKACNPQKTKRGKSEKKSFDWESLRRQTCKDGAKKERNEDTMDTLDWDAVRNADVHEISNTIRERGMNNMLAERIKNFLDRLVKDHGTIDLEWLRDAPPEKAKDYLLSIRGLGLKSVECVRLLTLQHLAFPVDTNVGRICVRLGWVPLQPLPESLQLHLLELYPMLETIQKYLWPRLCTLDQRTLYELHYQMITFGKVFCTKSKPNCNACPMRGECKHFASAFASARLALPGPEEKNVITTAKPNHKVVFNSWPLPQLEGSSCIQQACGGNNCEPIIEEPATPEPECTCKVPDIPDIEDTFCEDPDEIPTIELNAKEFAQNLQTYMQENNMELQNVDWTKALVTLTPEAASIPTPKLKNVSRLRTEHQVYELPDSHPLLEGLDRREPQDPCPYLLAIWTPGETAQSTEPPESCSNAQEEGRLCEKSTCFSCNSIREAQAQTVRGTLLIPCRTAMRGSFPLNGTYFQVNEVFADHDSSLTPIDVPRTLIWNLPRRTVYFGTSVPTIFRGLAIEDIQNCFWRGFVCVRGFDRKTRGPRPLMARLHFPASKVPKANKKAAKGGVDKKIEP